LNNLPFPRSAPYAVYKGVQRDLVAAAVSIGVVLMLAVAASLLAWCLKSRRRRAQRELRRRGKQRWLLTQQTAQGRPGFDLSCRGSACSVLYVPPEMDAFSGSLGRLTPHSLCVSKETLGPQDGSYRGLARQCRRSSRFRSSISSGNLSGLARVSVRNSLHNNMLRNGSSGLELRDRDPRSCKYAIVQRDKVCRFRPSLYGDGEVDAVLDYERPHQPYHSPEKEHWVDDGWQMSEMHPPDSPQSYSEFGSNSQLERYNSYTNELIYEPSSSPGSMNGLAKSCSQYKHRRKHHKPISSGEHVNRKMSLTTFGVPKVS
ncbi:hypothetical protein FBUS_01121, partial [Fasciolopsis buskii]